MATVSTVICLCTILGVVNSSHAESSRFWLPISYQSYRPRLLEAAEKVAEREQCHTLLEGTLAEKKSINQKVVFSFRCRNADKQTRVFIVNASDLSMSNTEEVLRLKAIEDAKLAEQERLREKFANRKQYWAVCEQAFMDETLPFNAPKIITPLPIKPDISEKKEFIYLIEFQTLSSKGKTLSYLATAVIDDLSACTIDIRPI